MIRTRPTIVKIGGGAGMNLPAIIGDLRSIDGPVVIVHGANVLRDQIATAMGIERQEVKSLKGYTSVFSDNAMLDAMMASYSGIRNKRIVELCQQHDINAIGLTGLDGRIVQGRRNPGIRTMKDGRKVLLRDLSGKPQAINVRLIELLMANGYTPVLTPPILDENGVAINTENDDVVALLARELNAIRVISLIEAPGVLEEASDPTSLVPKIARRDLEELEARVDGRMRRKIKALGNLFAEGYPRGLEVVLTDGREDHPITNALSGRGTVVAGSDTAQATPTRTAAELQNQFELDVYGKRGPTLVSGSGVMVRDTEGREYVDCIAGHGALILGHGHPDVLAAMTQQAHRLSTCPGSFYNDARAEYLEALIGAAPGGLARAFLCNSGTEAVEAAIKFARLQTQRAGIVAMNGAFHGRTFGAMSASSSREMSDPFQPLLPGITHTPFNDLDSLTAVMSDETAAVILELVQGEGGVHIADRDFVLGARALCDQHGALLILDEVQTGFGRTGTVFAVEQYGVRPDMICTAKGIAAGFPMGAVLVSDEVHVGVGLHGSTFGGHPVACAAATATLKVLQSGNLLGSVSDKGTRFVNRIRDANLRLVRDIRQRGLMIGIELRVRARPFLASLAEQGVFALPAGSKVIRFLPPLVIDQNTLDRVADAVIAVLSADQPAAMSDAS